MNYGLRFELYSLQESIVPQKNMPDRKIFPDSITPLPAQEGITPQGFMMNFARPADIDKTMRLVFSLAMPADLQAALENKVARGEVLSPEEIKKTYTPSAGEIQTLVSWLKAQGYADVEASPNGTGVYASAKASLIQQTLEVNMVRVTRDGITYTAAQDAPSLPAEVSGCVHAIIGLQPFRQANKHRACPASERRHRSHSAPAVLPDSARPAITGAPPYTISEILKAYNADDLGVSGKNQTIAILIDTAPANTDLSLFWSLNNTNDNLQRVQTINVNNQTLPPIEGEESLDAEWTSGIAPDAEIRIYASGSLNFVSLDRALDQILTDLSDFPGMRQLSISLGLGEQDLGSPAGEVATQHQKYLRLAAAGVNIFVSTGDAGSNPDPTGHGSNGPLQVEYAASDPCVVGVGGTTLVLSADGKVSSETGWVSGGGGESMFFPRPDWQKGKGITTGTKRLVPDVSLTADPNEGALVVLNGQQQQIGGTSWSAPVWAGFCALINEARAKAGKPLLGFLNPLIYPLIGTSAFRDITQGSNGHYKAGAGYDMVTGIGVPDVKELMGKL